MIWGIFVDVWLVFIKFLKLMFKNIDKILVIDNVFLIGNDVLYRLMLLKV